MHTLSYLIAATNIYLISYASPICVSGAVMEEKITRHSQKKHRQENDAFNRHIVHTMRLVYVCWDDKSFPLCDPDISNRFWKNLTRTG